MILLINVFITNQSATGGVWESLGVGYNRGNLNFPNKIDILKYMLASYAVAYPWSKVIIKTQLDTSYDSFEIRNDLENFIKEEFKNYNLYFSFKRNLTQQDWIETYKLIDDELIFNLCSHDHIFIDNSAEYFIDIIQNVKSEYKNDYVTIAPSHWPEGIRAAKCGYISNQEINPTKFNKDYALNNNFISYNTLCFDSITIISKNLYEDWFVKYNWNDAYNLYPQGTFASNQIELPRIDGVGKTDLNFIRNTILKKPTPQQKMFIPYKEMIRHFDGYNHQNITNNQCPALDIPPGFFENNIKIRYGYDDYKEGWVNINPKNKYYYAYDKLGMDYRFTLNDLPLFWKKRISVIDSNSNINEEEMIQYRLKNVLEMVYSDQRYNPYIEEKLKNKILIKYLQSYPNYELL